MSLKFARGSFLFLLFACLIASGCRRDVVAPGDPVAAVKGMATALRDNDLVRYSRLSVPPALHRRLEARWHARQASARPPSAEQQREYARWLARLTAADAEQRLYRSFDGKIRKVEAEIGSQWPLMQATGGIFVNGLIQANDKLSPAEKDHAKAVGAALLAWATPAMVADRAKAKLAIAVLTDTARGLELPPTLAATRQLEMIPSLEKAGQVLAGLKRIGLIYGLDADQALAGVTARVISADGDTATLEVSYPLLGKTVSFDMQMLRREGRWYSADAVRSAEAKLAKPVVVVNRPAAP